MRTAPFLALMALALACGNSDGKNDGKRDLERATQARPSTSDDPAEPKPTLVVIDLSPGGIDAVMQAPQQSRVTARFGNAVVEGPTGAFRLEIGAGWVDIPARKDDLTRGADPLIRMVVDEPTAIVYETKAATPEYHVIVNAMAGDTKLSCEDSKGPAYSESSAMAMLDACRSISGKP